MKSLKKNYTYNVLYQILSLIVPFLTVPYVSRVLGADKIGVYSFTNSIVTYFSLFAMLGINHYGVREIAKCRADEKRCSRTFSGIYAIQFLMSLIMIAGYVGYILFFSGEYRTIALIQGISLLAVVFDFNWFFFGLEEFKLTVTRNALVKILTLIMIFALVRPENGLVTYTMILSLGSFVSNLLLVPFLKQHIWFSWPSKGEVLRHLKHCLVLFVPVFSVSLYTVMDKTMLGMMSDMEEVGYYTQAEKIASMPLVIVTALGAVMMPRMSNLVENAQHGRIRRYIDTSVRFVSIFSVPLALGLASVASAFVPVFLGVGFEKSVLVLVILSVTIILKSFGNVFRVQYMTPHGMDREYAITTIIGAIVNLGINAMLIPKFGAIGAAVGTVFAETTVVVYMGYILRLELPLGEYGKTLVPYLIKGGVMLVAVLTVERILDSSNMVKLVAEIVVGGMVYAMLNISQLSKIIRRKG